MPYATYRFNKIIAAETIRFIVTVAIVVYKGLKLVVYRMLTNLPASRKREFSPVNEGKRETAIERLCMETASMAVFYTQDAWSYSYFISNYKSSFLLKNYFSCDR